MYMNEYDIERAKERSRRFPVLHRAVVFLQQFKSEVDYHSDGWAYWRPPVAAATKLMELIDKHTDERLDAPMQDITEAEFRKVLSPIKAFYTKRGNAAGMKFPGDAEWTAREDAAKARARLIAAAPKLLAELTHTARNLRSMIHMLPVSVDPTERKSLESWLARTGEAIREAEGGAE